jgi:hypothetical protein
MSDAQDGSPTPVYRAVDSLTAAIIELQQLRRRMNGEQPPSVPEIDHSLDSLEARLHELAATVAGIRDDVQHETS